MSRRINSEILTLTDAKIARLSRPGLFAVGSNLYVNVTSTGSRQWIFRYRHNGRRRDMGLGSTELVTLGDARTMALECRKLLAQGGDPIERRRIDREQKRLALAKRSLFTDCVKAYYDTHRSSWSEGYAKRWHANITTYATPILGPLPIDDIDVQLLLQVLGDMWQRVPVLAKKLAGWLEAVFDYAVVSGRRGRPDNPAKWRGHLDKILAAPSKLAPVQHHAALRWREIPTFLAAVQGDQSVIARAVALITLTACRKGEALRSQWAEFDLKEQVWTVPAERMKTRRPHRVPLSTAALEALTDLRHSVGGHPLPQTYLFTWRGKPLNAGAPDKLLTRIGYAGRMTMHGLRSSHTDFAAEVTNLPREVREMALAHVAGDDVERAYLRTDLFQRRRDLAEAWGNWCVGRPIDSAVLVNGKLLAAKTA